MDVNEDCAIVRFIIKNDRNTKAVNFFIAVFYSVNKQTIIEPKAVVPKETEGSREFEGQSVFDEPPKRSKGVQLRLF